MSVEPYVYVGKTLRCFVKCLEEHGRINDQPMHVLRKLEINHNCAQIADLLSVNYEEILYNTVINKAEIVGTNQKGLS